MTHLLSEEAGSGSTVEDVKSGPSDSKPVQLTPPSTEPDRRCSLSRLGGERERVTWAEDPAVV